MTPTRGGGGGLPARRAVVRWAVRLLRRDWRQQVLVVGLLTVAVGGSAFGASAAYGLTASSDATFGAAEHLMRLDATDPEVLATRLAAARAWFGTTEEIGHRSVPVPGRFDHVDVRAQDPSGPYGAPMLALREGRYPSGAGEVAVTDGVAAVLGTGVGGSMDTGGDSRLVVGVVENPYDLGDEFALVDVARAGPLRSVTVLVPGDRSRLDAFRATIPGPLVRESRSDSPRTLMAVVTLALATVGLLLVSLVAAAGFVVVAQRRLRQLGMLAAMGATRRHLRLAMLADGTVIGIVAAVVGTVVGIGAWVAVAGRLEHSAGHRIDRFDLPWSTLAAGMVLAVVTATAAAWWPARVIARTPVMSALSSRPAPPKPARRSALAAVGLLAAGVALLVWSGATNLPMIGAGILATVTGALLGAPLAIRVVAAMRGGFPVAVRLALTDLVRYQARAGAALAAIALALGICVAVIAGSAAAEHTTREAAGLGNLASSALLIRIGQPEPVLPARTPAELTAFQAATDAIAATLDRPTVTPLDMAAVASRDEATADGRGPAGHPVVEVGILRPDRDSYSANPLYVATPQILALYRLDSTSIRADVDVLTAGATDIQLTNIPARRLRPTTQPLPRLGYTSTPNLLLTVTAMNRHGWTPIRVGWLVQAGQPLTEQQRAAVQSLAADAGLTVEFRREQASLETLRSGAAAVGMLLAMGILATTVGLIRGEGAGDLRILTATGAPRRTRRTLTATTAGTLALLGSVVGLAAAYLVLASLLHRDPGALADVPFAHLGAVTVGSPLLAAAAGWVLAGRQPPSISRRGLD